jgi:hypothetical protein
MGLVTYSESRRNSMESIRTEFLVGTTAYEMRLLDLNQSEADLYGAIHSTHRLRMHGTQALEEPPFID